jgi:hypothetical protein
VHLLVCDNKWIFKMHGATIKINTTIIFRIVIISVVQCVCFIRLNYFMVFVLFRKHHLWGAPTQRRVKRDRISSSSKNRKDHLIGRRCTGKRSPGDFTETGRGWASRVRRRIRTTYADHSMARKESVKNWQRRNHSLCSFINYTQLSL